MTKGTTTPTRGKRAETVKKESTKEELRTCSQLDQGPQEDVHSKQQGRARVDNKACWSEAQEVAGRGNNEVTSCY